MEAASLDERTGEERTQLKRVIGPRVLTVFIIGDILGAGIYALVGEVGAEVGGAIWTAFLTSFVLAFFTAFAYAELVTKYPFAAGAALYTQKAFRAPFLTFVVAFGVMASGIASASTLARAFAGDYLGEFVDLPLVLAALIFIVLVAAINARGIAESVQINVVLTSIEVIGLIIIVVIGVAALGEGSGDFSRNFEFKEGESVFGALVAGTALAFYAMIGFEDSVNVAEEAKQPSRNYPRALFVGLAVAGALYLLVTLTASYVVPTDQLSGSDAPLLEVVEVGPLGSQHEVVRVHRPDGGVQQRIDQHDHGLPHRLRDGRAGHRLAPVRARAARAPDADRGDRLHDADRRRADHHRGPGHAGRYDGDPAACSSSRSSTSPCSCCAANRSSTSTSQPPPSFP